MRVNPLESPLDSYPKPSKKQGSFPSARYFQVHFEYLHELLRDMKQQLDVSNQKIDLLQQQLKQVMPVVSNETDQTH